MSTYTSASFARSIKDTKEIEVFVTGRDQANVSRIGIARFHLNNDECKLISISGKPILDIGNLGCFDENGVSYPFLIENEGQVFMYYVGWMPTVCTPFNIQLGLAKELESGKFEKLSQAPVLQRTATEPLSIGSCCVRIEDGLWKMWYTGFESWEKDSSTCKAKHLYTIKYATSNNGIDWERENKVCIKLRATEIAICRPSIIKDELGVYHMFFSYRGDSYKMGYAQSIDGINWERKDQLAGLDVSDSGWDDSAIAYPHCFKHNDEWYMLYNGNEYGKTGLGLAKCKNLKS